MKINYADNNLVLQSENDNDIDALCAVELHVEVGDDKKLYLY